MTTDERYRALLDLISARPPVEQTIGRLGSFPWDSDQVLVVLFAADAARVLRRYLQSRMSAEQCVLWADAVEARDDIGFDPDHVEKLKRFIFEIANPEMEGALTLERARLWLRLLEDAGANAGSEWAAGDS